MAGPSPRFLLLFLAVSIFLPDYSVREHRIRFMRSYMKISTGKANPPRIAFLESMMIGSEKKAASNAIVGPVIQLSEVLAQKNLRPALQAVRYRRVDIQPMTFARDEALLSLGIQAGVRKAHNHSTHISETQLSDDGWQSQLTWKEKRILQSANLSQQDLDFSNIENPAEKALSEKIQEEIRNVRSAVPSGWVISGSGAPANAPQGVVQATDSSSTESSGTPRDFNRNKEKRNEVGGFKIEGHLGLDASTPYLPGYHFEIHWMREGVSRAAGEIFPNQDWRYGIEVSELIGSVRVDLFDGYGSLVAFGNLRLSPDLQAGDMRNALIQLQPARRVAGVFKDFVRSFANDKSSFKAQARTKMAIDEETEFVPDKEGRLNVDGVAPLSSTFAYSEGEGFYPAIHTLHAGVTQSMTLMPEKTVTALQQIIAEQRNSSSYVAPNGSLVWGQVTSQGKPVAGIRVEVANETSARAVYLNSLLIPDPTLHATSANGFFIFVDLPAGYYSLRAYHGPQFYGFGNVLTEPGTVSYATLESSVHRAPFEVRAFDAFTGEEQAGNIHFQALGDQSIAIAGYGVLDIPVSRQIGLAWFEPRESDFVNSIHAYYGNADHLHVPLVRRSWIEGLQQQAVAVPQPEKGTFVGFVAQGGYEVRLPHLPKDTPMQIVFFDSQGRMVAGPVAQGGFVIFNIPAGGETIVLRHASGETQSQVIPVDAGQTTIVRFQP